MERMNGQITANRQFFKDSVAEEQMIYAPLCLNPLMARIATEVGFKYGYLSGGALGFELAISEALLTVNEIREYARQIISRSEIGLIVDIGVGFGDPVHTWRAIRELEAVGATAVEIEDQVAPKRVHHHKGVEHLVSSQDMIEKIKEAVSAREDRTFQIIARTSAISNESMESALSRAKEYREAGADVILLQPRDEQELEAIRSHLQPPLALISAPGRWPEETLLESGFRLMFDPFTAQVASVQAVKTVFETVSRHGSLAELDSMMNEYRKLQIYAGLESLYELEERTTEK